MLQDFLSRKICKEDFTVLSETLKTTPEIFTIRSATEPGEMWIIKVNMQAWGERLKAGEFLGRPGAAMYLLLQEFVVFHQTGAGRYVKQSA